MKISRSTKEKQTPFPAFIKPMLATLTKEPFNNEDWIYEVKWDGFRVTAYINKGTVKLLSRSGLNYTKNYPTIVQELEKLKHDAVIDGELVLIDESGRPNFDELQRFNGKLPLIYYAFDIIWLNGKLLTSLPLVERKEILQSILPQSEDIKYSDHFEDGLALFEQMKEMQLEGIMAKKKASTYQPGVRTKDWLKIQTSKREEFVVGGWTESAHSRMFRSLVFGWHIDGKLHYVGHAGHGFKESEMFAILLE